MQTLQDGWAQNPQGPGLEPQVYITSLQECFQWAREQAQANLQQAQEKQKRYYDQQAKTQQFQVGNRVLVWSLLFPKAATQEWEGPYTVTQVKLPLTYDVRCDPRPWDTKTLHVNLIKWWYEPATDAQTVAWSEQHQAPLSSRDLPWKSTVQDPEVPSIDARLDGTSQWQQVKTTLTEHAAVFSTLPGWTEQVQHIININTATGQVCQCPLRPLPWSQWEVVNQEVEEMLRLGVIEPSASAWRSPIVLVPKPDGSVHFCIDFREVNKIATFDTYPMP